MGRRKIEIRAIKDDRNRSVTFLKRKGGLFKKAHELSVLCSVDVAVIIFGHNKKLYEFSSGDIQETLRRYQYARSSLPNNCTSTNDPQYGQAHEHKGPADFKGKGGGEDDEDEDEDVDMVSHDREDSMPPQQHQMMPPQIHHQSAYPHLQQNGPMPSPPMSNGMFQPPRDGTPQPQMGSRPSSRNTVRRASSNLVPMQHPHSTPPPPQNGFAYMPNPPIYNPQAQPPPQPSPQPQYQPFPMQAPPPQQQQQPPQHPQMQNPHQAYLQDQRRHSQPQMIRQDSLQPPPHPASRLSPQPEQQGFKQPQAISPPQPKHMSSKSRSIFTPIDDGGSVLARHFMFGNEPPRPQIKQEQQNEIRPPPRSVTAPVKPRSAPPPPPRDSGTPEFAPPSRTNTSGSKSGAARPKLNLQIPSEASDDEAVSASPQQSGLGISDGTVRNGSDSQSVIHLPPPSPSTNQVLSAGASGPPNPFARPAPPNAQNNQAYSDNRNNIDTPISALPSRFVNENLLPSPSSFYPEWGFGRSGPDSALLPSPLPFPTPIASSAPQGFGRGEPENLGDKRKGSEERIGEQKRAKT